MTLSLDYTHRTVVVTGVGRKGQVGEVVAGALGARGARVIVVERDTATAHERAAELRDAGVDAFAHVCDLTDVGAVSAAAQEIAEHNPHGIHGLVHLAGGFSSFGPVAESDPEVWHRLIAINLTTAYVTTRALLPLLRKARGSIVYFAAAAALPGGAVSALSAYAAAKTGVLTLMRAVSVEEKDTGVRANAIAPTNIRTATNVEAMGEHMKYVERETIADWVLWLCHPASGPVSGQSFKLG